MLHCMPEMLMPKNIAGVGTCCKELEPDFWFVATFITAKFCNSLKDTDRAWYLLSHEHDIFRKGPKCSEHENIILHVVTNFTCRISTPTS